MTGDRATAFLEDILDQPAALARLLDAYEAPGGPLDALPRWTEHAPRVAFVGLGSSRYAALDAAAALRGLGIAAWTDHAALAGSAPPSPGLVLVAVSASGRTAEVVEAVERHRGRSFVVGVTNRPDEPVGRDADVVLPLLAGDERAGISCLTYGATRAVLGLLGDRLVGRPPGIRALRSLIDDLEALAAGRASWLEPAVDLLDRAPAIGVVGPAERLGVAEQAALMLREAPRLPAVASETGEWFHTAIYTALPGYRAVLLAASTPDERLVRTVHDRGGAVLAIGRVADADLVIDLDDLDGRSGAVIGAIESMAVGILAATSWARTIANARALE